jgi:putative spermidine/putrescine transport system permease protein
MKGGTKSKDRELPYRKPIWTVRILFRKSLWIAAIIYLIVMLLLPFIALLPWAFSKSWYYPDLIPEQFSLRGWRAVLAPRSRLIEGFINSTVIASVVSVVAMVIGLMAGRALGLYKFKGRSAIELLLLAPVIFPTIAVAMGIQVTFIRLGLANTLPGVILVHLVPTIPYVSLVMGGVFSNYDVQFEHQARVLGAGAFSTLLYVTIPIVRPGLIVAGLFAFILSWSEFLLTQLIGGGSIITLPILLFTFIRSDIQLAATLAIIYLVPAILVLGLTARYMTGESSAIGGIRVA